MTGKIEPALTPEEWATFPNWPMAVGRRGGDGHGD